MTRDRINRREQCTADMNKGRVRTKRCLREHVGKRALNKFAINVDDLESTTFGG